MKYNDNGTVKELKAKVYDTLPVGTEVDYSGSTVPDGWIQIDDPNVYSTTETICGTWIDGGPIYRKVCYISALPSSIGTTEKYDVNIRNANYVVNCYGSCSNGNWFNAYRCDNAEAAIGCWYDIDTQRITITVGKDRSSLSAYIVVEYTKNTSL